MGLTSWSVNYSLTHIHAFCSKCHEGRPGVFTHYSGHHNFISTVKHNRLPDGKRIVLWYQLWDQKTLLMFQLNASVFIMVKVKTEAGSWQGFLFPISELASENSLFRSCRSHLRSNHSESRLLAVSVQVGIGTRKMSIQEDTQSYQSISDIMVCAKPFQDFHPSLWHTWDGRTG